MTLIIIVCSDIINYFKLFKQERVIVGDLFRSLRGPLKKNIDDINFIIIVYENKTFNYGTVQHKY